MRWYFAFSFPATPTTYPYKCSLTLGSTGLDEQNVTILHYVVLALGHDLALGLDLGFVTELLERREVVDNGLDKRLLEIGVDDTGGLGRLGALADGPLANLVGSRCEEAAQLEGLAHLDNELGQSGLGTHPLLLLLGLLLGLEPGQALLEGDGDGDDGVALGVLLDPLGNLGQVLVLLADVILFGQVDKIDNGLGREQEERVDNLNLWIGQLVSEAQTDGVNSAQWFVD